jgi:GxxExxY protein
MEEKLKHADITDKILKAFFTKVYRRLGYGFLEKVYVNALVIELRRMAMKVDEQVRILVHYDGIVVGEYYADLVVEDLVIVECKAIKKLDEDDEAQLLNYLRATPYEVGLLLNFGPRPEFRRGAFDNANKASVTWGPKWNGDADYADDADNADKATEK